MEFDDDEIYLLNGTNVTDQTSSFSEPESLNVIVPLTILYVVILVAGVLGNISTCVVIGRIRSMHTATNFYLFSLAISDLLLLLCGLPLEVHRLWKPLSYPLGEAVCITFGLISETSANATVLIITAFTVERYIAICRPFISHTMSKLSRAVRYIILIWICAFFSAVPQAMQFGVVTYSDKGQNISACTVKGHGVHQVFVTSSFVFFVLPMSLITVLYVLIGLKLRSSHILHRVKNTSNDSKDRSNGVPRHRSGASQRKVIRMLVAVALSFFLCWAPFHVQRLIAIYGKNLEHPSDTFFQVYIILTYLSGVLYFLSTAINPVLYNIMSNKFRNAFKMSLSMWCRRGSPRLERTYSAIIASRRERAAMRTQRERQTHKPRYLRRLSTASSQLGDAPPRAQSYHQSGLAIVNEMPDVSWVWKQHLPEKSDSCISPRSISNSSLYELDQEMSREELATFMYQVNCSIGAIT